MPALVEDEAIRQDMHAVSSLLKMYFRELPNPLCTYQLYDQFVNAVQGPDELRVVRMREVRRPASGVIASLFARLIDEPRGLIERNWALFALSGRAAASAASLPHARVPDAPPVPRCRAQRIDRHDR